jgi:hypothetical protein
MGGTILGASRDYVDADDTAAINDITNRLARLGIDGLICIGGDGTLNAMQALSNALPTVLAPKTIDNDLGLNYRNEPDDWQRVPITRKLQPAAVGAASAGSVDSAADAATQRTGQAHSAQPSQRCNTATCVPPHAPAST